METVLFENNGLLTRDTKNWALSFDENFVEVNSAVKNYERRDDLHLFAMLINPKLKTVLSSSAFVTVMPFDACLMNGKEDLANEWTQLDYFSWLVYEAVRFRSHHKTPTPLSLHLNYLGVDFLKKVDKGEKGLDVKTYLKLIFNQFEGHVTLTLYSDFKKVKTVSKFKELNFLTF